MIDRSCLALPLLGHSVDNPGQLPSLGVVPVVVEQLGEGDDDEEGEHPAHSLQHALLLLSFLRRRAQYGGVNVH